MCHREGNYAFDIADIVLVLVVLSALSQAQLFVN